MWVEGICDLECFLVNGDKVVVYFYVWVCLYGEMDWMGGWFVDGFVFCDGWIMEYLFFGECVDVFVWVGIGEDMV